MHSFCDCTASSTNGTDRVVKKIVIGTSKITQNALHACNCMLTRLLCTSGFTVRKRTSTSASGVSQTVHACALTKVFVNEFAPSSLPGCKLVYKNFGHRTKRKLFWLTPLARVHGAFSCVYPRVQNEQVSMQLQSAKQTRINKRT